MHIVHGDGACVPRLARNPGVEECGTDFWEHIRRARECREELFPGSEISSSRTTHICMNVIHHIHDIT